MCIQLITPEVINENRQEGETESQRTANKYNLHCDSEDVNKRSSRKVRNRDNIVGNIFFLKATK